jgi:Domain of unknown function (DUF4351)
LEKLFQLELKTFEEARQMKYVTTIERTAEARGEARGWARALVLKLLARKLGAVGALAVERINGLSVAQVEALGEALLDFGAAADLDVWLESQE